MGITPEREIIRTRKKLASNIFHEEFIYEMSKHEHARFFDERTHGQPETNMPRQLLQSWGHNETSFIMC